MASSSTILYTGKRFEKIVKNWKTSRCRGARFCRSWHWGRCRNDCQGTRSFFIRWRHFAIDDVIIWNNLFQTWQRCSGWVDSKGLLRAKFFDYFSYFSRAVPSLLHTLGPWYFDWWLWQRRQNHRNQSVQWHRMCLSLWWTWPGFPCLRRIHMTS